MRAAPGIVALLVVAFVVGCGGEGDGGEDEGRPGPDAGPPPVACTEIGCGPGLYLDAATITRELPRAAAVRFCLEGKCRTFDPRRDVVAMGLENLRHQRRVSLRMTVLAAGGATLLRRGTKAPVRRSFPNGPNCPPPCFQVAVILQPGTLDLIAPF